MVSRLDLRKLIVRIIMALILVLFLVPLLLMISSSFKIEEDVLAFHIQWLPQTWNAVENYREVWTGSMPFLLLYWNSIKVTVLTTLTSVFISALAAYGFAKINFKG